VAYVLIAGVIFAYLGYLVWDHSRPKRYFFVRHGATLLNEQHIKQGPEGGLSPTGRKQAELAGIYLVQFHIQKIIASPYERTRQTAEIINTKLHTSISYSSLLRERTNPSTVIGKSTKDPEVAHVVDLVELRFHDDDFRYADEENFLDLQTRARDTLRYLERQPYARMCVVTHHFFLKSLLGYMLYREKLHFSDYLKLSFFNTLDNGGITICEFHPWRQWNKSRGWSVLSFNEQFGVPIEIQNILDSLKPAQMPMMPPAAVSATEENEK
jgi:broad specificity phosphatase PhoE